MEDGETVSPKELDRFVRCAGPTRWGGSVYVRVSPDDYRRCRATDHPRGVAFYKFLNTHLNLVCISCLETREKALG